MKHIIIRLATITALMLALTACGGGESAGPDEPAQPAVGSDGEAVEIDVVAGDIFYEPDGVEIPAGSSLIVNLSNEGALEHDFALDGDPGTGILQGGESGTAEVGPFDSSTTAYCTIAGHREAGMEFEITVTN